MFYFSQTLETNMTCSLCSLAPVWGWVFHQTLLLDTIFSFKKKKESLLPNPGLGGSDGKESACNVGDSGSNPG